MAVNKMTLLFCFCCFASWLSGRAGSRSLTRKLLYECDLLPAPVLCTHRYSISPQSGGEHTDSVFPFGARPESFNHPKTRPAHQMANNYTLLLQIIALPLLLDYS